MIFNEDLKGIKGPCPLTTIVHKVYLAPDIVSGDIANVKSMWGGFSCLNDTFDLDISERAVEKYVSEIKRYAIPFFVKTCNHRNISSCG